MEPAARGTKRPIVRRFDKCDGCRQKRIKCLPENRDFSKGERCHACENRDESCGPNKRATRPSLPRSPQLNGSFKQPHRPLVASNSPDVPPLEGTLDQTDLSDQHDIPPPARRASSSVFGSISSANSFSNPPATLTSSTRPSSYTTRNDSTRSSFIQLGDFRIIFKCVQDRRQAVIDLVSKNANTESSRNVKTALDFIAHCINRECRGLLDRVLGSLEDLEPCQTELWLVRALQAIEDLTEIARRPSFLGEPGDDPILKMHSEILNKLISIHEAHGDLPEAERLLGQLAALPGGATVPTDPRTSARLAESLLMTSRRSREVFGNLKIPKEYTDSLHFNETGPFPPSHRAVLHRNPDVIRHLCQTPQRVLAETDILRRKIVHIAAETANLDLLDLVTHQRQPLLKSRDIYQKTPLCVAAYCGHSGFFERLVNDGANLETRNGDGRTPLCIASGAGHLSIVKFLLARHVSPNDDPLHRWSSLHAAAQGGHYDICKALLDRGAWADWLSNFRKAAQVSDESGHREITAMLKEAEQHPRNQYPGGHLLPCLGQPQPPATPCTSLSIPTGTHLLALTTYTTSLPHQPPTGDSFLFVEDTSSIGRVYEFDDVHDSESRSFS